MKSLVIGSGGREHALCWALARSYRTSEVVVTPGNPGMADVARVVPAASDNASLLAVARRERPDLIVIGPEAPLVAGLADELRREGLTVFGPNRHAARLEGSKRLAKEFMARNDVPTAAFRAFGDWDQASTYLREVGAPIVIKDDRLAAGKGVTVCHTLEAALEAAQRVIASGGEVVVEECLSGPELSVLVLIDASGRVTLPLCRDYKRVGDGDTGLMTGGMGAVAPIEFDDDVVRAQLENSVVSRVLLGLEREGIAYNGVLFIGVMHTDSGFKVLEFNVRFGDPETQVLMPLLATDALELLTAVAEDRLNTIKPVFRDGGAACVVMAAPGYPGEPLRGIPLSLPAELPRTAEIFCAGVAASGSREAPLVSDGGRVLNVVARGRNLPQAVATAYEITDLVGFPGAVMRRDIGLGEGLSLAERLGRK